MALSSRCSKKHFAQLADHHSQGILHDAGADLPARVAGDRSRDGARARRSVRRRRLLADLRSCSTASPGSARRRCGRPGSTPRATGVRGAVGAPERRRGAAVVRGADRPPRRRRRSAALPAPQRAALEVALLRREPVGAPAGAAGDRARAAQRAARAGGPRPLRRDRRPPVARPASPTRSRSRRGGWTRAGRVPPRPRPGPASVLEQALARRGLERLRSGRSALGATRRLLSERLGLSLPRRSCAGSSSDRGQPAVRAGARPHAGERGMPGPARTSWCPDAVEDMLGTRVAGCRAAARRLLLAVALERRPAHGRARGDGSPPRSRRPSPPACCRRRRPRARGAPAARRRGAGQRARPSERLALHRDLAGAVPEREQRALHLALATSARTRGSPPPSPLRRRRPARGARPEAVRWPSRRCG